MLKNLSRLKVPQFSLRKNAILRPLLPEDVTQAYVDGLSDPDVQRYLDGTNTGSETLQTVRDFVSANFEDASAILFGLFVEGGHRGNVRLHDYDGHQAWIGIALFDKNIWGQGWATEILKTVADYAVDELQVRKVFAGIKRKNIGSERAFANAGFQIESKPNPDGNVWCFLRRN